MATLGAMTGIGVLAVAHTLLGRSLFGGFSAGLTRLHLSSQRVLIVALAAVVAAAIVQVVSGWPVAALWAGVGTLSVPLLRGPAAERRADHEIERVEAIATWAEQIRDTMSAAAGLQQALVATARAGPDPIAEELARFARRTPRGDLASSLRDLGDDLRHPSADLLIASLVSATELDAGQLVPLLSRLASSLRDEAHMRVRVEVGRARVRMSMRIVGICVGLTAALLLVAGGELLQAYDGVAGQLWLVVVGSVVVVAVWSSHRLAEMPQPDRFVARRR